MANDAKGRGETALDWIGWARIIQAVAQNGLHYTDSHFDRERYEKLMAVALEIFAAHTGEDRATLAQWLGTQGGYVTPKVDVRAACFRDGRVLLVRERSDGRWCLPGGWADVGDRPAESAERETLEESGFRCRATKLVGVFDANRRGELALHHAFKLVFLCEITGGAATGANHETTAVEFFERDATPPLSTARTSPKVLAECFAHLDDASRPTAFE